MAQVVFQQSELNELIQNPESGVTLIPKCSRQLNLTFYQLSNLQQSIKDYLYSTIAKYDSQVDGIILSYKKILIHDIFSLKADGKTKVWYTSDIYAFKPKIGCAITGIINKKSKDHLGCLVHRVFNIAIPRPRHKDAEQWIGNKLTIGQNVQFKVIDIELNEDMPYIKGELIDEFGLENEYSWEPDAEEQIEERSYNESPNKNKSSHKKHKNQESENDVNATVLNTSSGKKKKSKKHNDITLSQSDSEGFHNTSAVAKSKNFKKRRNSINENEHKKEERNYDTSRNELSDVNEEHPKKIKHKKKYSTDAENNTGQRSDEVLEDTENDSFKQKKKKRYKEFNEATNFENIYNNSNEDSHKISKHRKKHSIDNVYEERELNTSRVRFSDDYSKMNDENVSFKKKKNRSVEETRVENTNASDSNEDLYKSSKHKKKEKRNKSFDDIITKNDDSKIKKSKRNRSLDEIVAADLTTNFKSKHKKKHSNDYESYNTEFDNIRADTKSKASKKGRQSLNDDEDANLNNSFKQKKNKRNKSLNDTIDTEYSIEGADNDNYSRKQKKKKRSVDFNDIKKKLLENAVSDVDSKKSNRKRKHSIDNEDHEMSSHHLDDDYSKSTSSKKHSLTVSENDDSVYKPKKKKRKKSCGEATDLETENKFSSLESPSKNKKKHKRNSL